MIEKVRKPFIYLTIVAVILGVIGVLIIAEDFSGKIVYEEEKLSVYSSEQVSSHNNLGDCWVIIDNQIYDITPGLSMEELIGLKDNCGNKAEISDKLKSVIDVYKIGKLG